MGLSIITTPSILSVFSPKHLHNLSIILGMMGETAARTILDKVPIRMAYPRGISRAFFPAIQWAETKQAVQL